MYTIEGFLRWCSDKESVSQCRRCRRHRFDPWVGKIPWSRKWQLTPEFLPGKCHGQGNLAGYSPCGHRVRQQRAPTVGAEPDRKILQTMWKYFPDVNCYKSFFLCNFIFFYVSGSPKHAHYWMLIYNTAGYIFFPSYCRDKVSQHYYFGKRNCSLKLSCNYEIVFFFFSLQIGKKIYLLFGFWLSHESIFGLYDR